MVRGRGDAGTTGGTGYGMVKTTLYLPDDLEDQLTREAARRGARRPR